MVHEPTGLIQGKQKNYFITEKADIQLSAFYTFGKDIMLFLLSF